MGRTNRSKTPYVAVLLSTGAAFLTVVVNYYAPAKVFKFLIDSSGAIALLGYGQRVQWNNVIDTGVMMNWDKRPYDGKRESNLSVTFDATLRF